MKTSLCGGLRYTTTHSACSAYANTVDIHVVLICNANILYVASSFIYAKLLVAFSADSFILMQNLFMENSLPVATAPGIFGTKIPSTVAFAIALLLFLMPFAEIKCKPATKATTKKERSSRRFNLDIGSSMVTLTNSGLGIATGGGWKSGFGGAGNLFGSDRIASGMDRFNTQRPNPYAIAALVLGVAGLVFSVVKIKGGAFIATASGTLAAVALVGLLFDLMKKIKNPVNDVGNTGNETADWSLDKMRDVALSVHFTPWFYVTIIAFLAAAFFSYRRLQLVK